MSTRKGKVAWVTGGGSGIALAAIRFAAGMHPCTCVNEMIIGPSCNRFYLGGLEAPKR